VPDAVADLDGLTDFLYLHDNQLTSLRRLRQADHFTLHKTSVKTAFETWPESISWMAGLIEIRASDNRLTSLRSRLRASKSCAHRSPWQRLTHLPHIVARSPGET